MIRGLVLKNSSKYGEHGIGVNSMVGSCDDVVGINSACLGSGGYGRTGGVIRGMGLRVHIKVMNIVLE